MKPHRTDLVSLFFGLVFAGVAAWWLVAPRVGVQDAGAWFLIGVLILLGLFGVVSAVTRRGPRDVHAATDAADEDVADEPAAETVANR